MLQKAGLSILNTASEWQSCHASLRQLAKHFKKQRLDAEQGQQQGSVCSDLNFLPSGLAQQHLCVLFWEKGNITPLPGSISQDSRGSEQEHQDYPHHQCTASFFAFCRRAGFPAKSPKKHSECSFVWASQLQPPSCQGKMYLLAFLAHWLYLLKEHYDSWISNSQLGFYLLFKPAWIIRLIL